MALRRPAGLAVLAALVGVAMVALAPSSPRRVTAEPTGSSTWLSLTIIAAFTVPALVLVVIAVVRFRPRRAASPPRETRMSGNPWLGTLILLAFLAIAVGTVALLRPSRREPDPATDPPPTATDPAPDPGPPDDQPWFVVVLAIIAVLLAAAAFVRRGSPARPERPLAAPRPLATAVEKALRAVVRPATDPRTAIIQCYAAMEEALASVPGATPRPADSPSEVLDRATEAGAIRGAEAWRLVELFDEARFSRHTMSEPDRAAAQRSLRLILAELGGRA